MTNTGLKKHSKPKEKSSILTPSQSLALDYMKRDSNVFITGSAGTGKSHLIRYYKQHHNKRIPILSSTGVSAVILGGRTVHSFFSLGTMDEEIYVILGRIYRNPKLLARLQGLREVIIDEVSMLSGKVFDMIDAILKDIKQNDSPFGGVQLICVGDFFQIPPIDLLKDKKTPDYAFISKSWRNAHFVSVELKEPMRQSENEFLEVLNNIRQGVCTDRDDRFLRQHLLKQGEVFEGTRLFSKKDRVRNFNMKKLDEIQAPMQEYWTEFKGEEQHIKRMKKVLPIDDVIQLKIGALVMIRVNDNKNKEYEYVNGTMAKVYDFGYDHIKLQKLDGQIVSLKKHTFQMKDGEGTVICESINFPLTVAFAITSHKSQGSTIDRCIVDLNEAWNSQMIYVALSRVSSSQGLRIIGHNRRKISSNPLVKKYYQYIEMQRKDLEKDI